MKLDLIQCTVRLQNDGQNDKTEIVKSGPDAITPAEAIVLMMQHSLDDGPNGCAIRNAIKVGEIETTKQEEGFRLRRKYGPIVEQAFPRGRHMPSTIEDLELPPECIGKPRQMTLDATAPKTAHERKKEMRAALEAAGIEVPKGNLSEDDLQALMDEAGLTEKAA